MNDPTQNELLSAYLDGELDAAEAAEVERLLTADSAARQLLDDLRALSVALQSLPQEKVGEDLSEAVLRTAARRVLLEGAPGESERAAPECVPLGRSVFRRFFNVRGLVYAGITAAFALIIVAVEKRQESASFKDSNEVALSRPRPAMPAEEREGFPPTIQAARDSVVETAKPGSPPPAMKAVPAPEPRAERFALKSAQKAAPAADMSRAPSFAPPVRAGKGGPPADAGNKPPPGNEVLVVHCDVTPEAIANKDFEKLLAANGIDRSRNIDLNSWGADGLDVGRNDRAGAGRDNRTMDERRAGMEKSPPPDSNEPNLIYVVEATPEQIEATLNALAGRSKAFSNVSVNPPQNAPPAPLSLGMIGARSKTGDAADKGMGGKAADRAAEQSARSKAPSRRGEDTFGAAPPTNGVAEAEPARPRGPNAAGEESKPDDSKAKEYANGVAKAEPARPRGPNAAGEESKPGDSKAKEYAADRSRQEVKQEEDKRQSQAASQPAPRQRVLFVLRNVGGNQPPAAAARIQAAEEVEADKSQAQPAAPPPAKAPAKE